MDASMHNEPWRGGAFLTGPAKSAAKCGCRGKIKIAIIHNGKRVLWPHFHLNFGKIGNGGGGNLFANIQRAGKADRVYRRTFDKSLANAAARSHHQIKQPMRNILTRNDFA